MTEAKGAFLTLGKIFTVVWFVYTAYFLFFYTQIMDMFLNGLLKFGGC